MAKTWKNFVGYDYDIAREKLTRTLEEQGYAFTCEEGKSSFMLGSEGQSCAFVLQDSAGLRIVLQKATADPISRVALGFTSVNKNYCQGLSHMVIAPVCAETAPHIRAILQGFAEGFPQAPWDVSHHGKMRLAWLLRIMIRLRWKRWLEPRLEAA
ncbi:hypothetical protein LJC26_03825 [Desulfovibrio sp. OttesenSCG-928-O18]|nr:hypothetical protein [Desulfovibrio sp. OttesenSCG-928-O18]